MRAGRGSSRRPWSYRRGPVSITTYLRVFHQARALAFPDASGSLLAGRPYDLRHAALSTWLNAGVPPTQVAEWAGNSVQVLLSVYAKCIDGQDEAARRRIEAALGIPHEEAGDDDQAGEDGPQSLGAPTGGRGLVVRFAGEVPLSELLDDWPGPGA